MCRHWRAVAHRGKGPGAESLRRGVQAVRPKSNSLRPHKGRTKSAHSVMATTVRIVYRCHTKTGHFGSGMPSVLQVFSHEVMDKEEIMWPVSWFNPLETLRKIVAIHPIVTNWVTDPTLALQNKSNIWGTDRFLSYPAPFPQLESFIYDDRWFGKEK